MFQPAVFGRLIYTVLCMSDRLLIQENSNPRLTPPPDLRRADQEERADINTCRQLIHAQFPTVPQPAWLRRDKCRIDQRPFRRLSLRIPLFAESYIPPLVLYGSAARVSEQRVVWFGFYAMSANNIHSAHTLSHTLYRIYKRWPAF